MARTPILSTLVLVIAFAPVAAPASAEPAAASCLLVPSQDAAGAWQWVPLSQGPAGGRIQLNLRRDGPIYDASPPAGLWMPVRTPNPVGIRPQDADWTLELGFSASWRPDAPTGVEPSDVDLWVIADTSVGGSFVKREFERFTVEPATAGGSTPSAQRFLANFGRPSIPDAEIRSLDDVATQFYFSLDFPEDPVPVGSTGRLTVTLDFDHGPAAWLHVPSECDERGFFTPPADPDCRTEALCREPAVVAPRRGHHFTWDSGGASGDLAVAAEIRLLQESDCVITATLRTRIDSYGIARYGHIGWANGFHTTLFIGAATIVDAGAAGVEVKEFQDPYDETRYGVTVASYGLAPAGVYRFDLAGLDLRPHETPIGRRALALDVACEGDLILERFEVGREMRFFLDEEFQGGAHARVDGGVMGAGVAAAASVGRDFTLPDVRFYALTASSAGWLDLYHPTGHERFEQPPTELYVCDPLVTHGCLPCSTAGLSCFSFSEYRGGPGSWRMENTRVTGPPGRLMGAFLAFGPASDEPSVPVPQASDEPMEAFP